MLSAIYVMTIGRAGVNVLIEWRSDKFSAIAANFSI